ncbi:Sensor histidine kinase LiaS [Pontiella desulfatans]|uniref:histidine kinase n=1 Tax=Pontiella desulfatans TaxID=2750659 RepID=A0A6C2UB28_PONDE|nr:sensor histidine kinase [Pontiella desulfatans]VGO17235.1 Sensor histidine kinase LiaS [Pontiella desulfatans]
MKKSQAILLGAWLAYIGFSFFLFPALSITVFLASIPLAMLAGWLGRHQGVISTVALTIPYHFAVLLYHTDGGTILFETINPFGLGSQLIFGHSAALLKTTRDRYLLLNNSLEDLVKERTSELQELTHHLMETEKREYSDILESLLETPLAELRAMRSISLLLTEHLETTGHNQAGQAGHIGAVVEDCISNLETLEKHALPDTASEAGLEYFIRTLVNQLADLSQVEVELVSPENWTEVEEGKNHHLCQIVHEAVSNAIRHAKPSRIEIGVEQDPDATTLYIENNGTPFNAGESNGMGLPIMHYRASKIGATFAINSTNEKNTRVECKIPKKSA